MVRQKLCEIVISIPRRILECGPALVVLCIYIHTMLNKQACDIKVPTICREMQRRIAAVVPVIHVGTVFEQ